MTTIEQRGPRDLVPTDEVRAVLAPRLASSAEPRAVSPPPEARVVNVRFDGFLQPPPVDWVNATSTSTWVTAYPAVLALVSRLCVLGLRHTVRISVPIMSERVTVTIDGNVAVVSIDTPPVNALSVEVLRDLLPCP
jgi:hypothetical protein